MRSYDFDGPLNKSAATNKGLADGNDHYKTPGVAVEDHAKRRGYAEGTVEFNEYCRAWCRSARSEMMT